MFKVLRFIYRVVKKILFDDGPWPSIGWLDAREPIPEIRCHIGGIVVKEHATVTELRAFQTKREKEVLAYVLEIDLFETAKLVAQALDMHGCPRLSDTLVGFQFSYKGQAGMRRGQKEEECTITKLTEAKAPARYQGRMAERWRLKPQKPQTVVDIINRCRINDGLGQRGLPLQEVYHHSISKRIGDRSEGYKVQYKHKVKIFRHGSWVESLLNYAEEVKAWLEDQKNEREVETINAQLDLYEPLDE